MKKKHLLYSMALVASLAACSQDELVSSVNPGNETVTNDFAQYVGVPFEGKISFGNGNGVDTRMTMDDGLNFQWKEGDKVGLVWMNYDAISNAISKYALSLETPDVLDALSKAKIVKYDANNMHNKNGCTYSAYEYQTAIQNGTEIPVDGSYVWNRWPSSWKTASNTRMTYDGSSWFMTDGQVYKGMYLAYYPFDASRQSVSRFTVKQDAEQAQNATTYTSNADAVKTISNHILSTEPGVGMVWISRNIGDYMPGNGNNLQHSSFLYELTDQDTESGTSKEVNIQMYPFSNILDLRIAVDKGLLDEAVARKIEITSVELKAASEVFPTTGAFQMNHWGGNNLRNGVWGYAGTLSGDPTLFTWNVTGTSKDKYIEGGLVSKVTNTIQQPAPNNGAEQRVQLLLLPKYSENQDAALKGNNTYTLRINTDYGYIDIKEADTRFPWQYRKNSTSGLWINPSDREANFESVAEGDETKKLDYVLTLIGERATRYINFDADRLTYNSIDVSNTEELVEAIEKWNELGKSGNFTVNLTAGGTLENLIWSDKSEAVTLDTYQLEADNQPKGETITLGTAAEAIQKFLADENNKLTISSRDNDINLAGTCAIDNDRIAFSKTVAMDGTLGVTDEAAFSKGLNTSATSKVYVANENDAVLTVGGSAANTWEGEMWIYQDGKVSIKDIRTAVTNLGTLHINGHFVVDEVPNGAVTFTNADDEEGNDKGIVKLYSYANVDGGKGNSTTFTNNSIIYYVDVVSAFQKSNIGYKNNDKVYAEINAANVGNHKDAYLSAANTFGATDLFITDVEISGSEWNNLGNNLSNFKRVQLKGNVTWNSFKEITMKNAVFTVDGVAKFTGNNQASALTLKQFVLSAGAQLQVTNMSVAESTLTVMNNNTSLTGYDNFAKVDQQPNFVGTGYHNIFDEEGNAMFN